MASLRSDVGHVLAAAGRFPPTLTEGPNGRFLLSEQKDRIRLVWRRFPWEFEGKKRRFGLTIRVGGRSLVAAAGRFAPCLPLVFLDMPDKFYEGHRSSEISFTRASKAPTCLHHLFPFEGSIPLW